MNILLAQISDLPIETQIEAFFAGAAFVAPFMSIMLILHYARRGARGGE